MIEAPTYESLCRKLKSGFFLDRKVPRGNGNSSNMLHNFIVAPSYNNFVERISVPLFNKVKMVGILFCQPSHRLSKEEIVNNIKYYHHRSGSNIDFYCSGYGAYWNASEYRDMQQVCKVDNVEWYFSSFAFNKFREEMEQRSKWRYGGEVELLLLNAKLDKDGKRVFLDMTSSIVCNLDEHQL